MKREKLEHMTDEEVIRLIRNGEDDADGAVDFLMNKYKNMVRSKAKTLYLIGADHDDLIQEGMIGLFHGIRDYDLSREGGFAAFASLCVNRQIYKAIEAQNRKKNQPLNHYISLDTPVYPENDQDDISLMDVLRGEMQSGLAGGLPAGANSNPEQAVIDKETLEQLEDRLDAVLSKLEKQVFLLFRDGMTYQQIARQLGKEPKSIDNALQRIKTKLSRILKES